MDKDASAPEPVWGASRSLAKLCIDKDDIVGLIAYGLFKQEQTEWATANRPSREDVDKHFNTLQNSRVEILRGSAELKLLSWVESLREQWENENFNAIRTNVADQISTEIERKISEKLTQELSQIRSATSFKSAITANIAGWLISLGITLLVALTFSKGIVDLFQRENSSEKTELTK